MRLESHLLFSELSPGPSSRIRSSAVKFHPEIAPCKRPDLSGGERAGNDLYPILSDGGEDGSDVLFGIDQGVGRSQLGQEMGIGVPDKGKSVGLRDLHGLLIEEVDPGGIKMAIFEGIKELKVLQKTPVQGVNSRKVGVRCDD